VIAAIAFFMISRSAQGSGALPPGIWLAYLVLMISAVVMLVMWIGALIRLAQQHAWGWFVGVLVLHLVGLGIIGMIAYAISGPEDTDAVVIRPSTPV
jgi:UPF0716 family protein affecting phage T7 exclusion